MIPRPSLLAQVIESELQQLFGGAPGFQQVKMNRGPRGTTCFVEFSDVATAMAAHQQHQVRLGSLSYERALKSSLSSGLGSCGVAVIMFETLRTASLDWKQQIKLGGAKGVQKRLQTKQVV